MTRALDRRVHALVDGWFDEDLRLLVAPSGRLDGRRVRRGTVGLLAPTLWWAHGLLRRGAPDDRRRARAAVAGVLAQEGDGGRAPRWPSHVAVGPVDRVGEQDEPRGAGRGPASAAVASGLALLLTDHRAALVGDVGTRAAAAAQRVAHDLAGASTPAGGPEVPWLLAWAGREAADDALREHAEVLGRALLDAARRAGHAVGADGPTSGGRLLLGLSLWAERAPTAWFAAAGAELRDLVWRDLLQAWHPRLRTLAPPLQHALGLDMREHVAPAAPWLAWLLRNTPALPPLDGGALAEAAELPAALLVEPLAGAGDRVRAVADGLTTTPLRAGAWTERRGAVTWSGVTGRVLSVGATRGPVDLHGSSTHVGAAMVWQTAGIGTAWLRVHVGAGPVVAEVELDGDEVVLRVPAARQQQLSLLVGGVEGPDLATPTRLEVAGRRLRMTGVTALRACRPTSAPDARWEASLTLDGGLLTIGTRVG